MINLVDAISNNLISNKISIPLNISLSALHKKIALLAVGIFISLAFLAYKFFFRNKKKADGINQHSNPPGINPINQPVINPINRPIKNPTKERWWTNVTKTQEFEEFKKNWKDLANSKAREQSANQLEVSYEEYGKNYLNNDFPYHAPFGTVYGIPGEFGLWMPGVALVASYLSEKKKLKGLHVCENLESLSEQIQKIQLNPSDQKYAFVVGTVLSQNHFEPNFPQHKVTVCIEKKDGKLNIALLDSEPIPGINKEISPDHLKGKLWEGHFNSQEIVYRAILAACKKTNCQARLLHSQVLREISYGCEVFALQDGIAFLRDPEFFNRIKCSKNKTVKIDEKYEIEAIDFLPPEYMIGSQSSKIIEDYKKQGGQFDKILPGKKKSLQNYLDAYQLEGIDNYGKKKKQNHYITNKIFKYLNFALLSLKHSSPSAVDEIINKTLIK